VGSGGVLLTHYSPFKVAEQFRMLETLFPGRIDLGLGRAPGGDANTIRAMEYGRGGIPVQAFPRQVEDLLGWLDNAFDRRTHPWGRVRAMPRGPTGPAVWLLGSGGESAYVAAELGTSYSFAQFISGLDGAAQVQAYRERFRPSAHLAAPRASVAVGVICAETRDEARRLASGLELWRRRIMRGADRGIPSPIEALAELEPGWTPPPLGLDGARAVIGTPDEVRDELHRIAGRYGVDEVMAVTVVHDFAARVHSYELLAGAMGLSRPDASATS
jgi:luciferase family oxidoreductase group 1